jgi:hypothetical protein
MFYCPTQKDLCWVSANDFISVINTPVVTSHSGGRYKINENDSPNAHEVNYIHIIIVDNTRKFPLVSYCPSLYTNTTYLI